MATNLISPNEAVQENPGDETSILRFGGHQSPLLVLNSLVPRLFDEVAEGVRALPRGGAEVGGLLLGPKGHPGGILANDIIPVAIEYRFGPSFRLSSADLAKVEEAIKLAHQDESKTVLGFYRSRTRGGIEFRESDQEILMAVELAHTTFATDFQFYLVFSPPARPDMPLSLALRNGSTWSDFRPYTCHTDPPGVTSDWGDPEPLETASQVEVAPPIPEPEPEPADIADISVPEFVSVEAEERVAGAQETAAAEPEILIENCPEPAAVEPEPAPVEHQEAAQAEPETMNSHSDELVTVETEALLSESHEPANADMETWNTDDHKPAKAAKGTRAGKATGTKKTKAPAKTPAKTEAAARPKTKKTTASKTLKPKASSIEAPPVEPVTPFVAEPQIENRWASAVVVAAEPKPVLVKKPHPAVAYIDQLRAQIARIDWNGLLSRIWQQRILWAGLAAVAVLALAIHFLGSKHAHAAAPPAQSQAVQPAGKQRLALTVEKRGADLVLSWNRDLPSIAHASYGMLIVRGKDGNRNVALTPEQLRAGTMVYTPGANHVEVELNVIADDRVTKDSVIVMIRPRSSVATS